MAEVNDNKVGAYCLCNGSTQTLSGLPRFTRGESGVGSVTITTKPLADSAHASIAPGKTLA